MWLTTFLIATLGFVFLLGPALSSGPYYSQYSWRWYDFSLRLYYAISAGLTSLILGLTFARVHYGEVHRGTIRSIILYPVDMNDIAIAKLLSTLIVSAALSTILFFGIFGAFFLVGEWPIADFLGGLPRRRAGRLPRFRGRLPDGQEAVSRHLHPMM